MTNLRRLRTMALSILLADLAAGLALANDCGPVTSHPVVAAAARTGAVGDLDGDGDVDVLVVTPHGTSWYRNENGAPGDWSEVAVDDVGLGGNLADLDGDGDLDFLRSSEWLENIGGDGEAWVVHQPPGYHAGVPVDMDGDGDLDLLTSEYSNQLIYWLENLAGDGQAWSLHLIDEVTSGFDRPEHVAAGDVDGDGDLDVVALTSAGVTVSWFENPGSGTLWKEWSILLAPAPGTRGLELADLDGDADLDVVVAESGSSEVLWFENTGAGQTWSTHLLFDQLEKPSLVAALDEDLDGDLDLLTGSGLFTGYTARFVVHANALGDASLWQEAVELPVEPEALRIAGIADVDGDADPDVVLVHWMESVHWYGALGFPSAQVARVGAPANPDVFSGSADGGPLVGTLWGPFIEHGSFVPEPVLDFALLSLAPANTDLGVAGTLLCNTSFAYIGIVANPVPGSPFAIDVPAECTWMGVPFSVQGGSVDAQAGVRLANALDVVVGSF